MKRVTAALLVLAVLAACFIGGASAYMDRRADDLEIRGGALCGDAAAAEGFTVNLDAVLGGHVVWASRYVPSTGERSTNHRWSWSDTELYERSYPPEVRLSGAWLDSGVSWSGTSNMDRLYDGQSVEDALYNSIKDEVEVGDTVSKTVLLNDYTDTLPLEFSAFRIENDDEEQLKRVFRVPLEEDVPVRLTMTRWQDGGEFNIDADLGQYIPSSASAFAADGNIYSLMLLMDENGVQADASLLPGGSWGVYRIPCEFTDGEPEGVRWWTDDPGVAAEPDGSELVFPLDAGCTAANLFLSYDGQYLQLVTCEGGELYFTVIDITSGEALSREKLPPVFDADGYDVEPEYGVWDMECTLYEDFAVFSSYDTLYVYEPCDGDYELKLCLDVNDAPLPEKYTWDNYGYDEYIEYSEYAWDGERLAVLDSGQVSFQEEKDGEWLEEDCARLCIYDGSSGELLYCDMLENQFTRELSYGWTPVYFRYGVSAA